MSFYNFLGHKFSQTLTHKGVLKYSIFQYDNYLVIPFNDKGIFILIRTLFYI